MFFKKNTLQNFPLNHDVGRRYLPWMAGLLTVLMILISSCFLAFYQPLIGFESAPNHTFTLEIPIANQTSEHLQNLTQKVLAALHEFPHLEDVKIIQKEYLLSLLEPWIGNSQDLQDLSLPIFIDVTFDQNHPVDIKALIYRLRQIAAGIRIEPHSRWQTLIHNTHQAIQIVAIGLLSFILIILMMIISLLTKTSLMAYRDIIENLRLMGAKNSFIAGQFQTQAFKGCLQGGFMGLALGLILVYVLNNLPSLLGHPIGVTPIMTLSNLGLFSLLPLLIAMISIVVARITVMRLLRLFDQ